MSEVCCFGAKEKRNQETGIANKSHCLFDCPFFSLSLSLTGRKRSACNLSIKRNRRIFCVHIRTCLYVYMSMSLCRIQNAIYLRHCIFLSNFQFICGDLSTFVIVACIHLQRQSKKDNYCWFMAQGKRFAATLPSFSPSLIPLILLPSMCDIWYLYVHILTATWAWLCHELSWRKKEVEKSREKPAIFAAPWLTWRVCNFFFFSAFNNDCLLQRIADGFLFGPKRFSIYYSALFMAPHMSYKVSKFIKYLHWFMRCDLIESVRRQVAKVIEGVNNDTLEKKTLWLLRHLPHVPQNRGG